MSFAKRVSEFKEKSKGLNERTKHSTADRNAKQRSFEPLIRPSSRSTPKARKDKCIDEDDPSLKNNK